jgi:AraC-like DNA-binding protein
VGEGALSTTTITTKSKKRSLQVVFLIMPLPKLNEITIDHLNNAYQFDWSTNDFLVSDEQQYLRIHDVPMHVDGYLIGICTKGSIKMEINLVQYEGAINSMIITTPHPVLKVLETSPDFRCRFIVFSRRFLTANFINPYVLDQFGFSTVTANPVVHLEKEEAMRLQSQFVYIWERFREKEHPFRKEITGNLLMALLYDFEASYQIHYQSLQKKLSRKEELNIKFQDLLFRSFRKEHGVRYYADKLFVTPKYLTEIIREVTGRSAGEWIDAALSIEAQALLHDPDLSVQEVANQLSFSDQSTFGKFFKKQVGKTPSEYRKG